jgi:hypothetical protein
MGKVLERICKIVEEKGGLPGRLNLVQMTGITQQQAVEMKDKAVIIKRFKKAAKEILHIDIDEMMK